MSEATRNIPFFNYPAQFICQEDELMAVLRDVMRRGAFILQKDLQEFEQNLAKFINVKHAFGVANGTEALVIALRAAGIKPGDEVIVPSHTFIASASAIYFVGATPVLVDCGPDHMIDPKSAVAAVTSKTRGIMPVQVNGRTANMDEIQKIADKHGLVIVEDAAQALGSKFKGRFAGTFGKAGTFSFYPAKLLGCFGDGGGIVTNDDQVAEQIYMLRDHGRDKDGVIKVWGYNSRLDNVQAAILSFKLKHFPHEITRRRELAKLYSDRLKDLPQMHLPPAPDSDPNHYDVYQNYEVEADRRDDLRSYLETNGVKTIIQWSGTPVHQFDKLGFKVKPPYTEKMFTRCFLLPFNTTLSNNDVEYVSEKIQSFYRNSK